MSKSILFLGSQMAVGGAQRVLLTQAQWFHEKGYRVTAAFFYDKEGLQQQWATEFPFPVIDIGVRNDNSGIRQAVKALWWFCGFLRRERFDIVETFTPHSNILGLPLAWMVGIPVRIASHHGIIENIPRWVERLHGWLVNSWIVTSLVAVSTRVYQHTTQTEGVKQANVELIPNGVFIPKEKYDINTVRQELGVKEFLVISVGRITSQKGHEYLLRVIPEVLQHHPQVIFAIVGDGPLLPDLKRQADELGIASAVRFLGTRGDVYRLLEAADVFVLPSISEGMPMALLEAMGMGAAVVASNLEGIADVVNDGEHGLLVPSAEVKSLSTSLRCVLDDAELRGKLSKNGRQLVLERFTVGRMCETYERLFLRGFQREQAQ